MLRLEAHKRYYDKELLDFICIKARAREYFSFR